MSRLLILHDVTNLRPTPTPKRGRGGGGCRRSHALFVTFPGRGVLWYFHTYVGSGYFFFFWFKILNFNIFWSFEKNEYFLGVWRFCGYLLGVITKFGEFEGHFYAFEGLVSGKGTELGSYLGLLKFRIFLGGAWSSWYFWGWAVDAGSEPTYTENIWVPPWGDILMLLGPMEVHDRFL